MNSSAIQSKLVLFVLMLSMALTINCVNPGDGLNIAPTVSTTIISYRDISAVVPTAANATDSLFIRAYTIIDSEFTDGVSLSNFSLEKNVASKDDDSTVYDTTISINSNTGIITILSTAPADNKENTAGQSYTVTANIVGHANLKTAKATFTLILYNSDTNNKDSNVIAADKILTETLAYTASPAVASERTVAVVTTTNPASVELTQGNFAFNKIPSPEFAAIDATKASSIRYGIIRGAVSSGISVVKGIEIDQTGVITVNTSVGSESSGTYTVFAEGTGAYTGQVSVPITLTIIGTSIGGSVSYPPISTDFYTVDVYSSAPTWIDQRNGQTVSYTIRPTDVGYNHLVFGTGVAIDKDTGIISVPKSSRNGTGPSSAGTYTVTASGIGEYQADIQSSLVYIIDANLPSLPPMCKLEYDANKEIARDIVNGTISSEPKWVDSTKEVGHAERNCPSIKTTTNTAGSLEPNYIIRPTVVGITINSSTGAITVTKDAHTGEREYTVYALGKKEINSGIVSTTVTIKVITNNITIPQALMP